MMLPNRRRNARRGAAGLGAIITLVVLQLVIVCVVVAGARDQNMTVQRLDSTRAMYAAEGVSQMAVREMIMVADEDNDGGIGSISDDGQAANDPSLAGGTATAALSTSGTDTIVTVSGRAGQARRSLSLTANVSSAFSRRVSYGAWPNSVPQYRVWTGSNWSGPMNTVDFGAKQYWVVTKRCPTRNEIIIVSSLQTNTLKAAVQSGMTWGNLIPATSDCGSTTYRPFSFAYEQASGNGLLVYRSGSSSNIFFRTWNGSGWSAQNSTASPVSGSPNWIRLIPKRGSNEVVALVLDGSGGLGAMVWNGSSFGNKVPLDSAAALVTTECFDAAYEAGTGRAVVAWGRAGATQAQYCTWDGASWSAVAAGPTVGAVPRWVRLAADPAGNRLLLGTLDASRRINVALWSGASWAAPFLVESSAYSITSRSFDIAFEGAGTRAMVLFCRASSLAPRYRVFDGSSWGAEGTAPALPAAPYVVQLTPSATGQELMSLINTTGGQNKLEFIRWNGTAFGAVQELLEANITGGLGPEPFMIVDEPVESSGASSLRLWQEIPPQ
jgi:Tfp pilus assembly protein PilX/cell wall assembly regulator SMI1